MSGRVLVLGFELGDGRLFRRFAAEGVMPNLARLLAKGRWRWLDTPAERLHVAAWPSLYTGAPPGEHGVYFTFQPRPGMRGWERFHIGLYGVPTFWKRLDEAGVRTLVLDAPYSHPEEGYRGRAVFDWGCWARYLDGVAAPATLFRELVRAVGRYPLPWEAHALGFAPLDTAELLRELPRALEARVAAAQWLAAREPWELFLLVFGETHAIGHYLFADEKALAEAHRRLDDAIGALLGLIGEEDTLLLVSADATRPNRSACHLLPGILARLGHYATAEHAAGEGSQEGAKAGFDPLKTVRDLLPRDLRKRLAGFLPRHLRDRLARHVDTAAVDWSRTRAYPLPSDLEGLVRINLAGREPDGRVSPGAPYEQLLDALERELCELVDGEGRAVVREVLRTDHIFPGRRRDHLPDLVVLWNEEADLTRITSPRIGTLAAPSPDPRPGTHGGPGFALTVSPAGNHGEVERGSVLDLAPSMLARFGLSIAGLTGHPWPELASSGEAS